MLNKSCDTASLSKYCEDKRDLLFAVFLNKSLIDDIELVKIQVNFQDKKVYIKHLYKAH